MEYISDYKRDSYGYGPRAHVRGERVDEEVEEEEGIAQPFVALQQLIGLARQHIGPANLPIGPVNQLIGPAVGPQNIGPANRPFPLAPAQQQPVRHFQPPLTPVEQTRGYALRPAF